MQCVNIGFLNLTNHHAELVPTYNMHQGLPTVQQNQRNVKRCVTHQVSGAKFGMQDLLRGVHRLAFGVPSIVSCIELCLRIGKRIPKGCAKVPNALDIRPIRSYCSLSKGSMHNSTSKEIPGR